MNTRRIVGGLVYTLAASVGLLAFLYPFLGGGASHDERAPLVAAALVGLALVALLVELQGQRMGAKTVALLGVLVAIASVLRFVEVAVPMPGGFSPIFAPIILAGYVFGGRFGFLMGALTLLVSALITGGVGPWLPYQMFAAGWVGLTAGWLSRLTFHVLRSTFHVPRSFPALLLLSLFAFAWGLLYGAIMNLYFWPFAVGPTGQSWQPGIGLGETLARYAAFYAVTSLGWDLVRAVGNAALILLLGRPVIQVFLRFRRRFHFEVRPADG